MLLQTFEVALNGVTNIRHCFVARFSLRDAAGQGWAFGDKHPVFIRFNRDAKFHIASLAIAGAVRNARKPVSYHARLAHIEIIEHVFASIEPFFEILRCRFLILRPFHTSRSPSLWITDVVLTSL